MLRGIAKDAFDLNKLIEGGQHVQAARRFGAICALYHSREEIASSANPNVRSLLFQLLRASPPATVEYALQTATMFAQDKSTHLSFILDNGIAEEIERLVCTNFIIESFAGDLLALVYWVAQETCGRDALGGPDGAVAQALRTVNESASPSHVTSRFLAFARRALDPLYATATEMAEEAAASPARIAASLRASIVNSQRSPLSGSIRHVPRTPLSRSPSAQLFRASLSPPATPSAQEEHIQNEEDMAARHSPIVLEPVSVPVPPTAE